MTPNNFIPMLSNDQFQFNYLELNAQMYANNCASTVWNNVINNSYNFSIPMHLTIPLAKANADIAFYCELQHARLINTQYINDSVSKTESKPVSKTESKPVSKTESKPVSKTESKPVFIKKSKPISALSSISSNQQNNDRLIYDKLIETNTNTEKSYLKSSISSRPIIWKKKISVKNSDAYEIFGYDNLETYRLNTLFDFGKECNDQGVKFNWNRINGILRLESNDREKMNFFVPKLKMIIESFRSIETIGSYRSNKQIIHDKKK
jgi:hypothetical protein